MGSLRIVKIYLFIYFKCLSPLFIVACSVCLLIACETTPSHQSSTGQTNTAPQLPQPLAQTNSDQAENLPGATALPKDLWERTRLNLSWQTMDNARVDKARLGVLRQANYFSVVSERADYYLFYIVEEVEKRGMPVELALIPVVESNLDPFATSYAGAAGLWQIMPRTGTHLGLEQNAWYDGRQALQDSTDGALDYLQSMYEQFDEDWLLALAAYNAGATTVSKARQRNREKGLDTDYWSLNLPREAYNYVPKIIALSQIVADPEQYDVEIPMVANAPSFEIADTGGPLHFVEAAQLADVDIDTLRALNPGHLRGSLSPHQPSELLLPIGTRDRFEANVGQRSPDERMQWQTYRIKRGDNLHRIAQKFDTNVTMLQQINGIRGSKIRTGDTLKVPGAGNFEANQLQASIEETTATGYQVRMGDSLYRIADRFKVSISSIIAWNALDPDDYLHPGQKLTLYVTGG
jgi:membrane-bound lytic murein transglycosylase D